MLGITGLVSVVFLRVNTILPIDGNTVSKIHSNTEIVQLINRIAQPDFMSQHDQSDGWFERYDGELANLAQAQKYLNAQRNTLRLGTSGNLQGKSVLDVGCGFGMACTIMKLLGADTVEGIDTFQPMIDTCKSYMQATPELSDIRVQNGLSYQLPFDDDSFDVVMNFEALSHFMHQEQSIAEAVRVLKPGGTYVIADDNNGANPSVVAMNAEIWQRFENGPTGDVHGHRVKLPYVESRAKILAEALPALDSASCNELARLTSYMKKDQIIAAGEQYLRDGQMPDSPFQQDRCPVEPLVGQMMENLINPVSLSTSLEKQDCDVDVIAYFGGDGKGGLIRVANAVLNICLPRSFIITKSPGFKIYATKC